MRLRPWQEAVLERAWAIDGDGRLLFRTIVVSTPRQSGKSWLARAWAVGRVHHPALFGQQVQTVGHMANNLQAAVRIHEQAWGWAVGMGLRLHREKGAERIVWPDGGQWRLSSLRGVYGSSLNGVILDEIWDIDPDTYREAIVPTQAARSHPQLMAVSTANPRSSPLAGQLMADGRLGLRRTLLADWGALEGDDPHDPAVWERASPHWDEQRAEEMELASGAPGFTSQWLNVWPESGEPWRWLPRHLTEQARAVLDWPAGDAGIVGVESRWNPSEERLPGRWAVAVAFRSGDSTLAVVRRADTLGEVIGLAGDRRIVAHQSTVEQLAAQGRSWRVQPINSIGARSSAETLAAALKARTLRVDSVDDATWAGVRIYPSDAGDVLDARRSLADIAPVKALAYAVHAVGVSSAAGPLLIA